MLVAVSVVGGILLSCVLAAGGWVLSVASDAPNVNKMKPIEKGQNSVIIAGDGSKLGLIDSDEIRTPIQLKDMPKNIQDATIAIEDERFYEHNGIDYTGGLRAMVKNLEEGEVTEGASTLTMQLMRNLYIINPKRSFQRKIMEAQMALDYEEEHSKKSILQSYLNTAPYGTNEGRTAIGVEAASKVYFSTKAAKLTLPQAALLAGLPQAPTDYNPISNAGGAIERRNEVLSNMADLGYISQKRARQASKAGLQLNPATGLFDRQQPFFFDYVENELIKEYGVNTVRQGGLRVYTTIEPAMQEAGLAAMQSNLPYSDDPSSALVSIDPKTGEVKAMVSSSSYLDSQYNLAAQGRRQPGSTFKTFTLTTAIEQGMDPNSTYYVSKPLSIDDPTYGHWDVATYGDTYSGTMSVTQATLASDNSVYAQMALDVGPENVAATAKKMGVTTKLDGYPAETLGGLKLGVSPLEMADAYSTLAAGGIHRDPVAIRKVIFPDKKVDHPDKPNPKRVLPEAVAYEVTKILNMNITGGTGTAAYTGCSGQAGKTGTTDNFTDAWFDGYQPNLSTAVWVGYPESNNISMTSVHGVSVAGGTFPAQIWNSYYNNAAVPCESFTIPTETMDYSSFGGGYTVDADTPSDFGDDTTDDSTDKKTDENTDDTSNPDQYEPGVGQDPAGTGTETPPASTGGGAGGGLSGSPITGGASPPG